MKNEAVEKLFQDAKNTLEDSYSRLIAKIKKVEGTPTGEFLERVLVWKTDKDKNQWVYEIFRKVFNVESKTVFFESLNSFVSNCLLDDSCFVIEWRKPDYIVTTKEFFGRTFEHRIIQFLPGGELKTVLTTKDDPQAKPEVIWSEGESCSQDPELLLEAMDIYEKREIDRLVELETM